MMVELDGMAYHTVPTNDNNPHCMANSTVCAFINDPLVDCKRDRYYMCSTEGGAPVNMVFLTAEQYAQWVAARLTS